MSPKQGKASETISQHQSFLLINFFTILCFACRGGISRIATDWNFKLFMENYNHFDVIVPKGNLVLEGKRKQGMFFTGYIFSPYLFLIFYYFYNRHEVF
jgi:hypothetical protein